MPQGPTINATRRGKHPFSDGARAWLAALALNLFLLSGMVLAQSNPVGRDNTDPDVDEFDDQKTAAIEVVTNASAMSALTTASQVVRLSPEEARRGYPVNLRGVVTCVVQEHNAFIIQDATHAVFVVNAPGEPLPERGEMLDLEGKSDRGTFAPLVRAKRMADLGAGILPDPVQANWDQLMNGSLDDQSVEIRGIVEQSIPRPSGYPSQWSKLIIRTTEGTLWVDVWLVGSHFENLTNYEDAVVRLRGCLFVALTLDTHELESAHVRMYVDSIQVDQPAPVDAFSAPKKSAADLTLFDPQANSLQRVTVSGQILYMLGEDYYLMDGTNGLRFTLRESNHSLHTGDQIDVAGYPELSGAAPNLHSAVARKTGHASLPPPKELMPDDLPNANYDATRVQIEGSLISSRTTATNEIMEVQAGSWRFIARIKKQAAPKVPLPPPPVIGSQLALIGVYAAQGGNPALDGNVAPFDLLVHASSDIKVLAKPSWWTLRRLLVTVGILVLALTFLTLWVTQLHRQVEQRTSELAVQIQTRERVEHQRSMEQERARIAQDLHDELGSGITEISMLATVAGTTPKNDNGNGKPLAEIGDRAREMVTTLDEIVWAMNPKHDSLQSLVSYSCLYADRLLKLANIACLLKGTVNLPDRAVSSGNRHEFFLAFKEAITNVIHHSGATEVRLAVRPIGKRLRISIADNGRGLTADAFTRGGDGLANMRTRLEKMGGRFEIASKQGRGTVVRFYLPLD